MSDSILHLGAESYRLMILVMLIVNLLFRTLHPGFKRRVTVLKQYKIREGLIALPLLGELAVVAVGLQALLLRQSVEVLDVKVALL